MDQDQDKGKNAFDLGKILLPKKEVQTPASATRVNAGVLLEEEQKAELPKQEAAPIEPPKKPQGPENSTPIAPLQTYQSDMQTVISQKDVSIVSIAAAEADRAAQTPVASAEAAAHAQNDWSWLKKTILITGSVLFASAAIGLLVYVFLRPTPSVLVSQAKSPAFIAVDDTQALVVMPQQFNRATVMQNLNNIRESTAISLGLISRMYVSLSSTTVENEIPPTIGIRSLLGLLAPNASDELLRSLDDQYYLLGTHVFDGNQEFLILRADSYEQAFSGMLQWERTMQQELYPLFSRSPRPRISGENATSTPPAQLLITPFHDRIVANHDARVIENEYGDILLLWTFIDRNTLVITTNENTLSEIISRRGTFTSPQ